MDLQQKVLSVDLMDTGSNDKSMDLGNGDTKTMVTSYTNPLSAELDEVRGSRLDCVVCILPVNPLLWNCYQV